MKNEQLTLHDQIEETKSISRLEKTEVSIFSNANIFEHWQRIAKMLSQSALVPNSYKGNIPNTLIALEISNRIGVSPFMVMQNMDIIHGKPSWSSTFIIAVINSCGRFSDILKFKHDGEGDNYGCIAYTKDLEGNLLESPKVDWKMVKSEGWLAKNGSKWKTMPELMFKYRSASFFGRLYCSDLLKGLQSVDEVMDVNNKSKIIN